MLFGESIRVHKLNKNWAEVSTIKDEYKGFVDPKQLLPLSELQFDEWTLGNQYLSDFYTKLNHLMAPKSFQEEAISVIMTNFKLVNGIMNWKFMKINPTTVHGKLQRII